jgi:hypothetical protein
VTNPAGRLTGTIVNKPVWFIAFGSPDKFVINLKVYERRFKATYQTFGTVTIPASGTESIGLPANAQAA